MSKLIYTLYLILFFTCPSWAQVEQFAITKKVVIRELDLVNDSNYYYTRVLVAGDILQEQVHINTAFNPDSNRYYYKNWFKQIRPVLFIGDIVIGNLETTFSGRDYAGYGSYSAPDEFLHALKKSGFNVLLTANDKAADREGGGIARTISMLDKAKIRHTGTFRSKEEREKNCPLILNVKNIKVAILNYTSQVKRQMASDELYNKLSLSLIKRDILKAKEQGADFIITYMHWGNEYDKKVLEYQKGIAKTCFEYGADAVFGSHPHYFHEVEIRRYLKDDKIHKGIVCYSLGNFLADVEKPGINGSAIIELILR
ncbi:MAG: CapA family protein, partial [Chitinophagales bacterium]|nr:CapA family protein [Chitinophagales bacterium]